MSIPGASNLWGGGCHSRTDPVQKRFVIHVIISGVKNIPHNRRALASLLRAGANVIPSPKTRRNLPPKTCTTLPEHLNYQEFDVSIRGFDTEIHPATTTKTPRPKSIGPKRGIFKSRSHPVGAKLLWHSGQGRWRSASGRGLLKRSQGGGVRGGRRAGGNVLTVE